jgi:hypothetical protein
VLVRLPLPQAHSEYGTIRHQAREVKPEVALRDVVIARIAMVGEARLNERPQATVCDEHCYEAARRQAQQQPANDDDDQASECTAQRNAGARGGTEQSAVWRDC